jgi:hypothetical protein
MWLWILGLEKHFKNIIIRNMHINKSPWRKLSEYKESITTCIQNIMTVEFKVNQKNVRKLDMNSS